MQQQPEPLIRQQQQVFPDGYTHIYNCEQSAAVAMNFMVLKLRAGQQESLTTTLESACLLMTGEVVFKYDKTTYGAFRTSYFNEDPIVMHTPAAMPTSVTALTDCELLLIQTENQQQFAPTVFDKISMLESERRGQGLLDDVSTRIVRTVFDKRNRPESNLVVGEIITFSGHWSSCPPHTHPQPEIYHYRFSEPQGFAIAEDGDDILRIKHNDTLIITDQKPHAHATAPGYALYTLWFIRHLPGLPYIQPDFNADHAWAKDLAANKRVWQPVAIT